MASKEYAEFGVVTAAAIACPPGTVVRTDRECAVKLPTGQTIKFWVTAELVDDDNDVYQDLDTAALLALGIHLEPDGGSVTEN